MKPSTELILMTFVVINGFIILFSTISRLKDEIRDLCKRVNDLENENMRIRK